MRKSGRKTNKHAFTIVELLVVIVVVGILAAITIVSYSNISTKAVIASLQSDLSTDAKILKLYNVEHGYFPNGIDNTTYCPTGPDIDTRYCLKASADTTLTYTGGGQTFMLRAVKNSQSWVITENSTAYAAGVPVVDTNISSSIAATTAKLGATIQSDGGAAITSAGICWGLTANPTTCTELQIGTLMAMSTPTIGTITNPGNIASSPDGKSIYVIGYNDGLIYCYDRDLSTGILSPSSTPTIATVMNANAITVSPDGKSVYAGGGNNLYLYNRDISSGVLTAQTTPSINIAAYVYGVVVSTNNQNVYVSSSSGVIYMYNRSLSDGSLSALGTPTIAAGSSVNKMTMSNDGRHLYAVRDSGATELIYIYDRNISTGLLTANTTPTITCAGNPDKIVITPDDRYVYVMGSSVVNMFSRDSSSGLLSSLSTPTISTVGTAYGMDMSPDGNTVYVSNGSSNQIIIYKRNTSTGALSMSLAFNATANYPRAVTVSGDGRSLYVSNANSSNIAMYSRMNDYNAINPFLQAITGLTTKVTYHYRGYATNAVGTGYSADSTFTTL